MLKSSYLKNNNEKRIEWIMIIEIDLIFITEKMIKYYKKKQKFFIKKRKFL